MNAIMLFALATVINVTLSTVRAIVTIKGGKWTSATMNALCYGFYPLIVMLTAEGTVGILINMAITAVANFVCVWVIKLIEEKSRKDRLWKVEMAIPKEHLGKVLTDLQSVKVPHNYQYVGSWVMFNCYCATQEDTRKITTIARHYEGKISAYESKGLSL